MSSSRATCVAPQQSADIKTFNVQVPCRQGIWMQGSGELNCRSPGLNGVADIEYYSRKSPSLCLTRKTFALSPTS